jgi:hypothetical protein
MAGDEVAQARAASRRRLLRGVGAGAAGLIGGAVVAGRPALAASGDPLVMGTFNSSGTDTTAITTLDSTDAALALGNTAGGAALLLTATAVDQIPTSPATGLIAADDQGNLMIGGSNFNGGTTSGWAYSEAWSTMTVPIYPVRVLDTRTPAGRVNIVSGANHIDAQGRLLAGSTLEVQLLGATNPAAVLANITVAQTAGAGYLTVWGSGTKPATSSLNFWLANQILSNFVESPASATGTLLIFAQQTCAVILDVNGFVVASLDQVSA